MKAADDSSTTAWPDRFIYVCNASKAAIANIAPLKHAGVERVAEAVVLCAARKTSLLQDDRREALEPAVALVAWLRDKGAPAEIVYLEEGEGADDLAVWARHMRVICDHGHAQGLPVVYCASGGRKQMTLGALWRPPAELRIVLVEGRPLRVCFVDDDNGTPVSRIAARHGEVTLDDYLLLNGSQECDVAARDRAEAFYRFWPAQLATFAGYAVALGDELFQLYGQASAVFFDRNGRFCGGQLNVWQPPRIRALRSLHSVDGCKIASSRDGINITVSEEIVAKVIMGGWLEALIFNRLSELLGPDCEIAANLTLQERDASDTRERSWGEADVAFMLHDQMHVVEAKAGSFRRDGGDTRRKALTQMTQFKHRLLGQFGRAWIVNPTAVEDDVRIGGFKTRAARAGVKLLYDFGAVDNLIREVGQMIAA